jgi:hypothetical protein
MTDLRKTAHGRECQIRYPGICNGNPETTVLAHLRMAGVTGIGHKSADLQAAWACSACHDEADRRTHHLTLGIARLGFLEGVMRTQAKLIQEGKVKW